MSFTEQQKYYTGVDIAESGPEFPTSNLKTDRLFYITATPGRGLYIYRNAVWTPVIEAGSVGAVLKIGDTMTGALVLSGAPTLDLHATTKLYTDTFDTNFVRGFNLTWSSISLLTVDAGRAVADDGSMMIAMTPAKTISNAIIGIGGFDVAPVADRIYFVSVIRHTSGNVEVIASLSVSPVVPPGYTKKRLVGCFYTGVGGIIAQFMQKGFYNQREFYYDSIFSIFASGYDTSVLKSVDLSNKIPPAPLVKSALINVAGHNIDAVESIYSITFRFADLGYAVILQNNFSATPSDGSYGTQMTVPVKSSRVFQASYNHGGAFLDNLQMWLNGFCYEI